MKQMPARLRQVAIALVLLGAAFILTHVLQPVFQQRPLLLFWTAALATSWYGGLALGLAAFVASVILVNFYLVPPLYDFDLSLFDAIHLTLFVIASGLLASVKGRLRRAEAEQQFLARSGEALGSSLDYEKTLTEIAHLAVPTIADWCIIDLLEDDGDLRRLVVVHRNPAKAELSRQLLHRYPMLRFSDEHTLTRVLRTGRAWLVSNMRDRELEAHARSPEHYALLRDLGYKSEIVVQLQARERVLGALTLVNGESGRRFGEHDLRLAEEVARRAAIAIDNARLFHETETQSERLAQLLRREHEARVQAEQANEVRLRFLAMVSHELRTPLASIKGFTSTLLAPDVHWEPEQYTEFIRIMDSEADKLTELVDQLLEVSRLQAGTLKINPTPCRVTDIMQRSTRDIQTAAGDHGLELQVPAALPPVIADCQRIGQVLVNLVDNAAKYSPDGTTITIRASVIEQAIRFEVSDEGVGIPVEDHEHVFEPFRQAHPELSRRGIGLGLAICKGLIEAHGGKIWVQNGTPVGTTIVFTLPLQAANTPPA